MKSDNAGCYQNSQGPEALFNIFKKYGLTLQRYDFNEPHEEKTSVTRKVSQQNHILEIMQTMGMISLMQMMMCIIDVYLHYESGM